MSSVLHSTLVKALVIWGDGPAQTYNYPTGIIQHQYNSPGTYSISMMVTDANQCSSDLLSHAVQVLPIPKAIISYDTACFGNKTTLKDLSLNSNPPGSWYVNGSSFPYQSTITPIINHAGLIPVKLIVQNSLACKDSVSVLVPVDSLPIPSFNYHDSICVAGMIRFWNLSVANGSPIAHYQWNFSDGYGSLLADPLHSFLQTNTSYNVGLTVISARGCSDSIHKNVTVSLPFSLGISTDTVCLGSLTHFNGKALTPAGDNLALQYWYFGDGNSSLAVNPVHHYVNPGTYTAILVGIDEHGCQDMAFDSNVIVNPLPTASFSYQVHCQGNVVDFLSTSQLLTSTGNTLEWTWQSGGAPQTTNNPAIQHTYPGPGTYQVRLVVFNGNKCSDTIVKQLVIDPPLQVSFTYDTACIGGSVHFQDLTQIAPSTWLWDFGTVPSSSATVANPLHAFTTAGNYIITLTAFDVNHCPYSLLKTIKILPLPLADFSTLPVNNCQQDSVHFIDISTTANGNIITRTWDFGDIASGNDNLSILQNPSHLYLQANSYSVTLGVQSNAGNGCVDTASHIILVRPSPIANFTFNLACFGDSTAFANISTPVNANSLSYVWNFGEASSATNNVSIQKNPKHHYASPGTYVVSLVVKDEFSCPDTIKKSVTVLPLPIVSFSHTTLCLGNPVQFTNLTNPLVGTTTQWYWTFGDPQSFTDSVSTLQNPQHTYISTGNYTVMLSVVTSNGCKSSTLSLISIPASPVANFSATDTCLGKQSFFHDLSTSANSPISSWAWDFGDTQNSGSQNPVHLFNFSGVYPVKLSVTDNAQCKGSKTIPVYVHALPNPDFYSVAYCTDNPVYFFDNSSGAGFPLTSWNWNFGDPSNLPNTSTVQNSSHAYTAQNFYNVSLSVVNSKGCENTLTQSVFIPTGAVADFSITNIDTCVGQLIHFHDLSYASGSTVTNWYWDFGNSIISTLKNPSLVFYSAGIQHVSLTITTSSGCTKTILRDIMVNPLPSVQFTYVTPLCEGSAVSFNGIASSPGSSGVFTWLWHMGYNGNQSTLQNPLPYTYPASGTYNVELNVTDSHHCTNKYVSAVAVYPKPAADFSFNLVHPPCENRLVCFTDHTNWFNSQPSVYFWTFGNSIAPDTSFLPDPCYTYPLNGNYIATLDVTSNYGCTNQVSKTVPVFPPVGPLAHFNTPMPPAGVHCTVDTVHFMDGSTSAGGSIAQWDWSFGDPTTGILDSSSLSSPYHLFSHAGTYAITLTVTDNNFCSSTFSSLITINPSPKAGFTMSNDCQGTLISFNDTSVSAANLTSWNWTADGVGAGNTANMHHLFSVTGNHSIKLVVTTQAGCSSSASKTLLVYPAPTASFLIQPAANACVNTAVSFDASASLANFGSNISYSWSFGDATIASVGPLVSHSYSLTQNYTINLFVENIHGCKDTLTKSLLVRPLPKPAIGVNSPTCLNDTIQFQGTSTVPNGSIQTWNWYFDHNPPGNYSSIQNPKHQFPASAPGPFHVQLTVTDAYCSSLITDTLTIHPLPVVNFTSDIACIGSPTHFTDLSTSANGPITSWKWYNGIPNVSTVQNPAFVLPVQGFNPVKLIVKDSKNCQNGITKLIAVDSLPIAAFSWHDTCTSGFNAGMIHFTDLSNPNSGTISNWTWNFTSGNSSSLQNPSYIFNPVNQNYPVTLTVSRRGCQVSVTHSVFVNPAFAIDFTYQASCLGSPSTFIPQVVQPVNMQHGLWSWKFGDNSPNGTSLGNTTHNFPLTGSYYVQLTTTSVHGCTDSIGHMIEVFPLPLPSFTYDTTYCFDATHFTNLSTAGSGTITTFNWNFGDGAPNVTTANPSHVYPPSGGSYWVKLTVTNSDNCNKTDSILVIHMPCGSAGFTISDTLPCTNIPITFTDTTNLGGSATFVDRIWDFGGFAPPSHASPVTVIYSATGTYTVMLIVKFQANSIQFSDTAIHQFTIFATPIAKIASDSACLGKDIHLVNQSSIATGAYSNLWNFGIPGGISIQQNPSPVHYNSPGAYLVTLSLVSDHNCRDTAQRIVHVWPIPVAAFSADPATYCGIPDKVTFTDLSSGTIDHLIWNFDYGIPATSPPGNQIMNYNAYGVFDPSLIVVSEKGCSDTIQHPGSITVLHKPVPSFSYDPKPVSILSSTVQFYNNSVSPGNFVCNWNFGDNTGWYPGNCNPNYTFADTGDYHVTLYIMDQNGCDSSVTEVLSVDGEMTVYVPNAFTPDGDNLNDVFGPTGKYLNPDAYEMVIYSRWGQELFSSTKPEIGWNGSVNGGVIAPVGVYVYYIRVKDLKGSTREFKGYVTLLRKD
ncbi:MAG: PKD domain-containing protein [Bacteroidota bacterium]